MTRSAERTYRITIIGGGIIGLTTACTILREYAEHPNLRLTIISEHFSPDTTADISAGFWEPYGLSVIDERTLRWAAYSYDIFLQEFFSDKAARAGLIKIPAYILNSSEEKSEVESQAFAKPQYSHLVRHFRTLEKHEIGLFDHLKPRSGFAMSSVVVEMNKYLPQLQRFLQQDRRVKFIKRKVHSISELKKKADVVINCSGLASRHLVGDETVRPARGQIIRVHAPWIKAAYQFHTSNGIGYIIPQSETVVLGGTFQLNDWSTTPNERDTREILRLCSQGLPALEQIRHGKVQVGLRPYRDDGVRLEHEKTKDGIDLVHCYGHSGSGVTLSWGCARDVVEIVKSLLPPHPKEEKKEVLEHEQLWRLVPNVGYLIIQAKL